MAPKQLPSPAHGAEPKGEHRPPQHHDRLDAAFGHDLTGDPHDRDPQPEVTDEIVLLVDVDLREMPSGPAGRASHDRARLITQMAPRTGEELDEKRLQGDCAFCRCSMSLGQLVCPRRK